MTGANLTHYTLSGPVFLLVSSELFNTNLSHSHRHGCIFFRTRVGKGDEGRHFWKNKEFSIFWQRKLRKLA